jgi:nucleotide-binding universal stress UspA family protein
MANTAIETILCPIDFSECSVAAYEYALSLAQHYQAKLFALHVAEIWRYSSASFAATADLYQEFCEEKLSTCAEQLQKFVNVHTHDGSGTECFIREGIARDCILEIAEEKAVSLIVMGTHGRRGFDRLMVGSVTEAVLRHAHPPVLATHQRSDKPPLSGPTPNKCELRRILFCTDFSDYSNRALDYALCLAADYSSDLTFVHVLDTSAFAPVRGTKAMTKARTDLEKLIPADTQKGHKIAITVRTGSPYKEIVQLASEEKADLVVMGVRGHNAVDLAVFGSTTYRVIQLGTCPVLAVPA